ncbi:homeodomain-interacting protein kinase 3-like [Centroberyx affinis]|uniref:homeodomain-interacting protein kinase 3-like n=1 Tax=Centroberyx affinis TaxID=166261 RepID=UPI003A5C4E84
MTDTTSLSTPSSSPPLLDPSASRSSNYLVLNQLGEGAFGTVARCVKRDTNEIVAVKTIKQCHRRIYATREVNMLQTLKCLDPDKCHIIRFHESFRTRCGTSLVFEVLDISLLNYMWGRGRLPLEFDDIRPIIQQLATALEALKSIGVTHTDLKLDNIMLVDHLKKPFKVKVIDFGLAIPRSECKPGSHLQPSFYRSPEILLGLPFSEAIDMWSLGCVMAYLYLGFHLFPGRLGHEVMQFIVDILGQPANHLLDAGLKTKMYFKKNPFSFRHPRWRLRTQVEFFRKTWEKTNDTRRYKFRSLDDLKKDQLVEQKITRYEFVDLLKEMLQMDASVRITPSEVLTHPFIINGSRSRHSSHSEALPPATTMQRDSETVDQKAQTRSQDTGKTKADDCTRSQPVVIMVQPFTDSMQEDGSSDNHQISPHAVDDSSLKLESVSETDMVTAITEATPSLDTTEVGAPAVAAAALNQTDLDNTESFYTAPEVNESKKTQKKKKKNVFRRFFSSVMKAVRRRVSPARDVE